MRVRPRSIYAEHYIKGSHRIGRSPRVDRPWRPRVIAWAGPDAFARNRFYELNSWYKARVAKPDRFPKMYVIDPDNHLQSLEERLAVPEPERYNIGFKHRDSLPIPEKLNLPEEVMDVLSRKMQLDVDLRLLEHFQISMFHHYRIFDDLFHAPVFMHNTQCMRIHWDGVGLYQGNLIDASSTTNKPAVAIESFSNGFSSLIVLNLDGNPYEKEGEVVQWMISNIPDGKLVEGGQEIVPYLQALPFRGTGFHRLVCLLLRHRVPVDLSRYKPTSDHLGNRVFSVSKLYKEHESHWTPSAIAFSQVTWDVSVNNALHSLGMKAPIYEYEYRRPLKMKQQEFPEKSQPFDLYLDQFMDPKNVQAELLKKRLRLRTIDKNPEQPEYPDINYVENKKNMPNFLHERLLKENSGSGRFESLWKNAIK